MPNQLTRAAALLHALTRGSRGVVLKPFAERSGWKLRALYRDLKALEAAGFPVQHEHGRYWIEKGWMPAAALGLSQDELLSLFLARHTMAGLRGTRMGRGIDQLWARLAATEGQPTLVPAAPLPFGLRGSPAIDYSGHDATIEALQLAVGKRRAVRIRYRRPDGEESERVVEPGYLHWDGGLEAMYVVAWCRLRSAVRVFAVHRIGACQLLDELVDPRASTSERSLRRAFRVWYGEQVEHVVLRFLPPVAGEIRERRWHDSQRLHEESGGVVRLELDIAAPAELERWLLGFGAAVRVVAPSSLAERVHAAHVDAAQLGTVITAARVPVTTAVRVARSATARSAPVARPARRKGGSARRRSPL